MFVFKSFILILAIVFKSCGVRSQNSKYNKNEIKSILTSKDFICFYLGLLLVATGSIVGDFADLTEVLDLNDAGNKCQN